MTTQRELIVITRPDAGLRASRAAMTSSSNSNVDPFNALLTSNNATIFPVFGNENRVSQIMSKPESAAAMAAAGIPNLTVFYRLVANDDRLDDLAENLRNLELVDGAYVKSAPQPPVFFEEGIAPPNQQEAPPVTPNYISNQLYLEAAPGGIDARFAWTRPGGKGQGVQIIDIEGAWRFSHEDLIQNQGGVSGGTQSADIGWRNHGTAVVGEFGGDENSFGVTGISPQANVRAISIFGAGQGSAKAITDAANALNPGDIILIELHAPGPRNNFTDIGGQLGFIAMEFWPDNFAAIVYATSVRGVIVVEAGGNGAENYDDPLYNNRPTGFPTSWSNPFNPANPQSGAIIVGAGAPPPGTHGRNHGSDRSRLNFSNFGTRVDVQGWGREVTTAGYGDLQGGSNEDLWYTDTFSGTSSASPIIVGAVASLQGALRAANRTLLTPATAQNILRSTGSPQQDEPGRPATQRIGNRPDLKQALTNLGLVGKSVLKDFKDNKAEVKEIKERVKDFKDNKEQVKEIKDNKEQVKEIKEKEKSEIKERKEIFEGGGKNLVEGRLQRFSTGATERLEGGLESRITELEQTVAELTHFISSELRPDLQFSALNQENDLLALSLQLEQQATDAKLSKDNKDIEKLREV